MDNTNIKEFVARHIPEATFEENKQFLSATVEPSILHGLLKALKENPETLFDYLFCITGADVQGKLMVIYHLESTTLKHQVVVKTGTPDRENPVFDSITDLFSGAELHENEIFDLFGIIFKGHPNLRRMFMPDDWKGYPLRKDYTDEVNIVELS